MSRPVIIPAMVFAIAVIGLAGAHAVHRSDVRARRMRDRAARDDSVRSRVAAQMDSETTARRAASASPCPRELPGASEWPEGSDENFPVTVPVLPGFSMDFDERRGAGRISFDGSNGESYGVVYGPRPSGIQDWSQYELVAECADLADVMPGTIQTARDRVAGGSTKAVLAAYRLPDGNFVSFHGMTSDVQRQAQFVLVAHHMRLKR